MAVKELDAVNAKIKQIILFFAEGGVVPPVEVFSWSSKKSNNKDGRTILIDQISSTMKKSITEDEILRNNCKQKLKKNSQTLSLIEKSRLAAYEPSKDSLGVRRSKTRLHEEQERQQQLKLDEVERLTRLRENARQDMIYGQIKSSEARFRIKSLKKQYQSNRVNQISKMVASQPTAIKAVRLESLLPPIPTKITFADTVASKQRMRIETLLEDELGLETGRILN